MRALLREASIIDDPGHHGTVAQHGGKDTRTDFSLQRFVTSRRLGNDDWAAEAQDATKGWMGHNVPFVEDGIALAPVGGLSRNTV